MAPLAAPLVEKGDKTPLDQLSPPHSGVFRRRSKSSLPGPFWLLTFAPPYPSPLRHPLKALRHPYTLYVIGTFAALVAGVAGPGYDLLNGWWTNKVTDTNAPAHEISARGNKAGWLMTIIGVVGFLSYTSFQGCCESQTCSRLAVLSRTDRTDGHAFPAFTVSLAGLKISNELRTAYFESVLAQDVSFFDHVGAGEVATRSNKDINLIRTGFGDRLGQVFFSFSLVVSALVASFVQTAKLAGILFSLIPFVGIVLGCVGVWLQTKTTQADHLEGDIASSIEQIISSSRIVQSFNIGTRLLVRLQQTLFLPLKKVGMARSMARALDQMGTFVTVILTYCLAFWAGSLVVAEGVQVGHVITVSNLSSLPYLKFLLNRRPLDRHSTIT